MQEVGGIEYEVDVDTSKVLKADKIVDDFSKSTVKGLGKIDKASSKTSARLNKITSTIRSARNPALLLGAAVTTAAVSMLAFSKSVATSNKEMETMAKLVRVNTDEMFKLAFAVESMGMSADQFSSSINDVTKNLSEFSKVGTGPFQDYVDVMGLTRSEGMQLADTLKTLSGPEALQFMVNEMTKANVPIEDMKFAIDSLGSDLDTIIPLFDKNGKALDELTGKYDDLVGVLSAKEVEQFKEFGKNFDLLSKSIGVFVSKVLAPMLPAINDATQALARFFRIASDGKTAEELRKENEELALGFIDLSTVTDRARNSAMRNNNEIKEQIRLNNELIAQRSKMGDNESDGANEISITKGATEWEMFVSNFKADIDEMSKDGDRLGENLGKSFANVAAGGVDKLSDGLANVLVEGGSVNDMFAQIGKTILTETLSSMIRVGIQYGINAVLANTASTSIAQTNNANNASQLPLALTLAGAQSTISFGAAAAIGGAALLATLALAKGAGRRTGGPMSPGMMQEAGEDGIEMMTMGNKQYIIPPRNATMTNNKDLMAGNGVSVDVNVINNVSDKVDVSVSSSADGRSIGITLNDVANDVRARGQVFSAITDTTTAQNRAGR